MKEIISFLSDIKENNNKEWFSAHKAQYESAKSEFLSIVGDIIEKISTFEPAMVNIAAKNCIFRINRDIRFSQDKSPYKTNFGASFNSEGKKSKKAGYYLHIQPGGCFLGGGIYMPEPDHLKLLRQEIDYNFDEFKNLITRSGFVKWYPQIYQSDKLARPPKDYEASNPAIEYLKLKHYIFMHEFDDKAVSSSKKLVQMCHEAFLELKPINDFLNRSFEN